MSDDEQVTMALVGGFPVEEVRILVTLTIPKPAAGSDDRIDAFWLSTRFFTDDRTDEDPLELWADLRASRLIRNRLIPHVPPGTLITTQVVGDVMRELAGLRVALVQARQAGG